MFQVGKPVVGNEFLDRTKILKTFKQNIDNKQNLMIKAPRRYGKTSLAKEVFRQTKINYLYLDYRKIPRAEIIADQIIDYAYSFAGIDSFVKNMGKNVMAFFKEHARSIKIKASIFEYSLEFLSEDKTANEKLVHALETLEHIASDLNICFYIVHDEFQDVVKLNHKDENILEIYRSIMQHQDSVCHYFLGSNETMMSEIFEDRKSPFFNFCRVFDLAPFDIDEVTSQLLKKFKSKHIMMESDELFRELLVRLQGHPANTIIVMQVLYYMALEKDVKLMKAKDIDKAYLIGFEETTALIERDIIDIKANKHQYDVIYRLANNEEQALAGQALNQVLKALVVKGFVYRLSHGEYEVVDGFLVEYLKLAKGY
jgi:uncharacterized protein